MLHIYSRHGMNTFQCIRIRILFESIHEYIHEYLEYFKTEILCSVLFANMTYLLVEGNTNYVLDLNKKWCNLHCQKDV
jgi:hypothetical protein